MGKAARRVRGEAQKKITKLIESLTGRFSMWEVWQDFIIMSAISIANTAGGPHRDAREKDYLSRAEKYSVDELEVFSAMLGEVVADMEREPDQDFLGEMFMALDLSNEWKGQFFTPYSVCRAMAAISCGDDLKAKIEQQGWVSVNDPACGAGALLLAFANECHRPGHDINFQTSVLFVAQDIDYLAGMMCYIQMSLMGCPGYVVIGDTIAHPSTSYDPRGLIPAGGSNVWFTPMYYRDVWRWRWIWAHMQTCRPYSLRTRSARRIAAAACVTAAPTASSCCHGISLRENAWSRASAATNAGTSTVTPRSGVNEERSVPDTLRRKNTQRVSQCGENREPRLSANRSKSSKEAAAMYKNQEGYHDPTPGQALANIRRADQHSRSDRIQTISVLMTIIRQAAALAGMEIVGRITFRDKGTGKEYR